LKNLVKVCDHPFRRCVAAKNLESAVALGFGKENASANQGARKRSGRRSEGTRRGLINGTFPTRRLTETASKVSRL
jgi:hypothetical protein